MCFQFTEVNSALQTWWFFQDQICSFMQRWAASSCVVSSTRNLAVFSASLGVSKGDAVYSLRMRCGSATVTQKHKENITYLQGLGLSNGPSWFSRHVVPVQLPWEACILPHLCGDHRQGIDLTVGNGLASKSSRLFFCSGSNPSLEERSRACNLMSTADGGACRWQRRRKDERRMFLRMSLTVVIIYLWKVVVCQAILALRHTFYLIIHQCWQRKWVISLAARMSSVLYFTGRYKLSVI